MTGGSETGGNLAGKCLVCRRNDSGDRKDCLDCNNHLLRVLSELEIYLRMLPLMMQKLRGEGGRMAPGFARSSPGRDEVMVALDPRSLPGDVDEHGDALLRRPDDTGSWVRSLPGSLEGIADSIAEERGEERPKGTLDRTLGYIRYRLWWVGETDAIEDVARDLLELHRQAQRLAHDAPQPPLAPCLEVTCEGEVFEGGPGRPARCGSCRRVYEGLDLIRLGASKETAA
jgi:hypothetical protein